ncbi:hypothetical protein [Deinococcus sp.]|uniref:hypothetical protein n=1 Tax=Deinococcus sp. TaxID=47478 RepID=UPI003B5AC174
MNLNRNAALALSLLALTVSALAQKTDTKMTDSKMTDTKMTDSKMSDGKMSGAPMLQFSKMADMNMMMSGEAVEVSAAPGFKLLSQSVKDHNATLVFQSKDSKGLFDFYNKAIKSEGWTQDANMKMPAMSKGEYAEAYVMKTFKLDLLAVNRGDRTTVTFKTH